MGVSSRDGAQIHLSAGHPIQRRWWKQKRPTSTKHDRHEWHLGDGVQSVGADGLLEDVVSFRNFVGRIGVHHPRIDFGNRFLDDL
jgi:hypothetical protein